MIETLLISVLIITLIASVLALLMVIAEATVGNYGVVKITINDSKEFEVIGGQPLLKTLNSEGIFIPSACGGRGSCGLCKVQVLEGGGNYLPTELPWINDEERKNQVRISCQLKVKNPLKIKIPEEL
ncbi:MAG: 2Fe-2S iron-sulfur cluster-binding protein, partial [Sphaerochaetaceae bacterium]|nr:2Fe-2S iron-sulfur cluster-binding protein [Sphaerochaetaceae bacterium]